MRIKSISRLLESQIASQIGKQKVILLYGTRRTGKTTLIEAIASALKNQALMLQGEDMQVIRLMQDRSVSNYQRLTYNKKVIIIDEAQAIPEIGKILKFMIDSIKGITIIATGSSSLDLVNNTGEPLVGRSVTYNLFPIAQAELIHIEDRVTTARNLEQRLVFGSYPELWHLGSDGEKETYLKQLVNSYLLKDLLAYENVKGAAVLFRLLQLLAWQVGSLVSTVELGKSLQLNKKTVERYMDLLSKVFIIFPLSGYSNNLRKEIIKSKKWYFFDNGIRNAIIGNFNPLINRNDVGQLWEQYILSERIKHNSYRNHHPEYFFWRTYDGQEIDFLEIQNMEIQALECKWQDRSPKMPAAFAKAYPKARFATIDQTNYLDWISG